MDLIIFILVICVILYLFRSFNAFIYFMALAEILLRLLAFLSEHLPIPEVTAWIKNNVPNSIQSLINNYSSGVLNDVLSEAVTIVQPPTDKGKRLKIFYMTQASTKPPTFIVFVNDKKLFHFSYERYLVNQIRKEFGLTGTPIRMIAREKTGKED